MSFKNDMDGRENSYEIATDGIIESYIDCNKDLQGVQNYVWFMISKLRSFLERLGADDYIKYLNELDDAVPVLVEVSVYALVNSFLKEPMAQAVIEDGLKGKPKEFVDYFEKLKECGDSPFFQPYPDMYYSDMTE